MTKVSANNPKDKLKILLVEDDADDYVIIRHHMSKIPGNGFSLEWVPGYDEALAALEPERYDLCLLDYHLGAHTGLELLDRMERENRHTPIIFLTGHGEYDVDIQAMNLGAADYLVKDQLTSDLLERSIRYTLDRAASQNALEKANELLERRVQEKTADLAEANRQLQRESEKIKLFAYSVSHDLKNPAISLYGLTKRLVQNYGEVLDEKGQAHCGHIMQSARQIATLTEGINAFIASKEAPMNLMDLELEKTVIRIGHEFSERLRLRNIKWSFSERLPVIHADSLSLDRVLRNLVDNALKYGGNELKEIRVGFRETKDFWIISVSDDGMGIGTKDHDSIFGPFMRIGSSRKVDGLGLGLAIVKEIADRHKGEVWAEPGPLGGASISVSFSKGIAQSKAGPNTAAPSQ
ncbi:MAG: response regulator [Deltaproteobacteria bacterium]|nr:response regulator [Deltaproteobacteria bacterium]